MTNAEIELDGMPEKQIMQTVRYTIERTTFVEAGDRRDVGDRRIEQGFEELTFEIVKVTHTVKDGNDVYQATAIEVL